MCKVSVRSLLPYGSTIRFINQVLYFLRGTLYKAEYFTLITVQSSSLYK